jgi:hypothetical protein
MAERNPNIPSERRQEMEERTQINEEEAKRRFAEKQSRIARQDQEYAERQASESNEGNTSAPKPE